MNFDALLRSRFSFYPLAMDVLGDDDIIRGFEPLLIRKGLSRGPIQVLSIIKMSIRTHASLTFHP